MLPGPRDPRPPCGGRDAAARTGRQRRLAYPGSGKRNYLAIDTNSAGSKTHSATIVDVEERNTNEGVWLIQGNSNAEFGGVVHFRVVDAEYRRDLSGPIYYLTGVGQLTDQPPRPLY